MKIWNPFKLQSKNLTWKDVAPPGQKVFFTFHDMNVTSDERDQLVPGDYDRDVYAWCKEMDVDAEIHMKLGGKSIWRIRDDAHRMLFILRWV